MRDHTTSAYPSDETLARYAGWARRLLAGDERISPYPPAEFARFVRVRLEGAARGTGLLAVFEAFESNLDYPEYHRTVVWRALLDGRPVPADVLRDYPGLQARCVRSRA